LCVMRPFGDVSWAEAEVALVAYSSITVIGTCKDCQGYAGAKVGAAAKGRKVYMQGSTMVERANRR
jgi:hypothetical protein